MKRKLIPRLDEPMTCIAFRVPDNLCDYIDKMARRRIQTRSDVVRGLVVEALRQQGVVANEDEMEPA